MARGDVKHLQQALRRLMETEQPDENESVEAMRDRVIEIMAEDLAKYIDSVLDKTTWTLPAGKVVTQVVGQATGTKNPNAIRIKHD